MLRCSWTALLLKMGPIVSPETSVNHQSTLPNIPEEHRPHSHCDTSLKSRTFGCNRPEQGQGSNRAPMKYKSERYCCGHLARYNGNYFNLVSSDTQVTVLACSYLPHKATGTKRVG